MHQGGVTSSGNSLLPLFHNVLLVIFKAFVCLHSEVLRFNPALLTMQFELSPDNLSFFHLCYGLKGKGY